MRSCRYLVLGLIWTGLQHGPICPAHAVTVNTAAGLADAVTAANSGGDTTILLENGTYTLDDMLMVETDGLTVQSVSGNRDLVVVQGEGMSGGVTHVFNVAGDNFTARNLTVGNVSQHAIQLQVDVDGAVMEKLRVFDTGEQMIKIPYDPGNLTATCDDGRVEDCRLEYTAGIGPQYYIGGVDAHNSKNWTVRNNVFIGIRSPSEDVAEFAIHFWSDSENTLVERNTIINCDRGIGFGLGDRGHVGGIIRNNFIYHDSSEGFADVGIAAETAPGVQIYNNTVFQEHSYPNAIEYRWAATTDALIANNLANRPVAQRDGASGDVSNNVTSAFASWFIAPSAGNLHLASQVVEVVDQGISIAGLADDFDGEVRPQGAGIDVGADEYSAAGLWYDSVDLGGGWRQIDWFGYVYVAASPWIYHSEHAWMYASGTTTADLWLYTLDMGWLWTGDPTYPHMYRNQDSAWLWYLRDTDDPRWFYNYATGEWEEQ
ncbi:hypothetical protein ACFLSJ_01950 [Verrucomicrobiota bacterium]